MGARFERFGGAWAVSGAVAQLAASLLWGRGSGDLRMLAVSAVSVLVIGVGAMRGARWTVVLATLVLLAGALHLAGKALGSGAEWVDAAIAMAALASLGVGVVASASVLGAEARVAAPAATPSDPPPLSLRRSTAVAAALAACVVALGAVHFVRSLLVGLAGRVTMPVVLGFYAALLAGGALGARLWQREARTRLGLPLSRLFGAVGPALVVLVGLAWGLGALDTSIDVARSVAESGGSTSLAARAAPAIRALARGLEREAASPTQGSGAVFLLAVLVAPFIEELFFRGVLFTGLRARLGVGLAAAASAAVFALGHAYQFAGYQVFAVGIVLALAMQRTGTLWTPVLIHAGWNLLLALS